MFALFELLQLGKQASAVGLVNPVPSPAKRGAAPRGLFAVFRRQLMR
jgi:hypothetical protein